MTRKDNRRHLRDMIDLFGISHFIHACSDPSAIAEYVTYTLVDGLGVEWAVLGLTEDHGPMTFWRARGLPKGGSSPRALAELRLLPEDSGKAAVECLSASRPVEVAEEKRAAKLCGGLNELLPSGGAIVVPLQARQRPLGLVITSSTCDGEFLSPSDLTVIYCLASHAAVALSNTLHSKSLTERLSRMDVLYRDALAMGTAQDEEDIGYLAATQAKELTHADKAAFCILHREGEQSDPECDVLAVRGRRAEHPETWWSSELERKATGAPAMREISSQTDQTVLLSVPFPIGGADVGALTIMKAAPDGFKEKEASALSTLAAHAASALRVLRRRAKEAATQVKADGNGWDGNERRVGAERRTDHLFGDACRTDRMEVARRLVHSQEEERRRISRELHDDTAQSLTSIIFRLQMCLDHCSGEQVELRASLEELREQASNALDDVHQMAFDLRPSMLDDLGLLPTLQRFVRTLNESGTLAAELRVEGDHETLASEADTVVLRVVQEALNNVRKHAHAAHALVSLKYDAELMELTVTDDGCGFDVKSAEGSAAVREALGLMGMRERVELLGGSLEVESASGKGTTVRARIPIFAAS